MRLFAHVCNENQLLDTCEAEEYEEKKQLLDNIIEQIFADDYLNASDNFILDVDEYNRLISITKKTFSDISIINYIDKDNKMLSKRNIQMLISL